MKTHLEEMMDRIELQKLEEQYDLNKKLNKKATELLNNFLMILDELGDDPEFIKEMEKDFEIWNILIKENKKEK